MEPRVGDLLTHVGFGSRTHIKRVAEVLHIKDDALLLHADQDPEAKYVKKFDVLRWWEVLAKAGETPPSWVRKGAVFIPRGVANNSRAVIMTPHVGWVSFHNQCPGYPSVFRIAEYDKFHENWEPFKAPSVWDHILEEET